MNRYLLPALAAFALGVSGAGAQAPRTQAPPPSPAPAMSTILRVPGKTVEILGLHRWTPAMIQDSMDVYSPGDSITSHACGAVLRYKLHFAEAAALGLPSLPGDSTEYVFVPVIEPEDSALVEHRQFALDTVGSRVPWTSLVELAKRNGNALDWAIRARLAARAKGRAPTISPGGAFVADSAAIHRAWVELDRHSDSTDAAAARRVLMEARNVYDRLAAVAILSSFDADDRTWWTLAATLREQEGTPRFLAGMVLDALARAHPRAVDWRPAAADLHAVLNGANFWVFDKILTTLTATGVGPDVAGPLLRHGGHAVLMYAGAAHPEPRTAALAFLRAVSGMDYGRDVTRWQAWIAAL